MVAITAQAVIHRPTRAYAQSGMPTFGGDSGLFGRPDPLKPPAGCQPSIYSRTIRLGGWGVDSASATTSSASAAGAEIGSTPYTHVDPNILAGGLVETEWGSNGAALGHIPIIGLRRK